MEEPSSGRPSANKADRAWLRGMVVAGTIAAGATLIPYLVWEYSNELNPTFPLDTWWFWGPLLAGGVFTTLLFGGSGVKARFGCWLGAILGGALAGWYVAADSGYSAAVGLLYAVTAATVLTTPYLIVLLIVGPLIRRRFGRPDARTGFVLAVLLPVIVVAGVGTVVAFGERGTFVCPPWPLTQEQLPSGYCADLVGRGEPFPVWCRAVEPRLLGRSLGSRDLYGGKVHQDARSIRETEAADAVAIRQDFADPSDCGEWQFAPSALLSPPERWRLAKEVSRPGKFEPY